MRDQLKLHFHGQPDSVDSTNSVMHEFLVMKPGDAENQLTDYLLRKTCNPKLGACILIGHKASKAKGVHKLLKGMGLVHEGRVGQSFCAEGQSYLVPYSFQIYQDLP